MFCPWELALSIDLFSWCAHYEFLATVTFVFPYIRPAFSCIIEHRIPKAFQTYIAPSELHFNLACHLRSHAGCAWHAFHKSSLKKLKRKRKGKEKRLLPTATPGRVHCTKTGKTLLSPLPCSLYIPNPSRWNSPHDNNTVCSTWIRLCCLNRRRRIRTLLRLPPANESCSIHSTPLTMRQIHMTTAKDLIRR